MPGTLREEIEGHLPYIRRVVTQIAGRHPWLDDLTQECCVRLIEKEELWQKKGDLKPWIRVVTRNTVFNFLKSKKFKSGAAQVEAAEESDKAQHFSESDIEWVVTQFVHLSPRQKEIIHLKYFEGYKNVEIANRLGVTEAAISMQIKRSLSLLQQRARQEGLLSVLLPGWVLNQRKQPGPISQGIWHGMAQQSLRWFAMTALIVSLGFYWLVDNAPPGAKPHTVILPSETNLKAGNHSIAEESRLQSTADPAALLRQTKQGTDLEENGPVKVSNDEQASRNQALSDANAVFVERMRGGLRFANASVENKMAHFITVEESEINIKKDLRDGRPKKDILYDLLDPIAEHRNAAKNVARLHQQSPLNDQEVKDNICAMYFQAMNLDKSQQSHVEHMVYEHMRELERQGIPAAYGSVLYVRSLPKYLPALTSRQEAILSEERRKMRLQFKVFLTNEQLDQYNLFFPE